MKTFKSIALWLFAICLVLLVTFQGLMLRRCGRAREAKQQGQEIVSAIEIYLASHNEPPPDLKSLRLTDAATNRWNYTREGAGYAITCNIVEPFRWNSSVLAYVRYENYWIQGWVLTDENGEWE